MDYYDILSKIIVGAISGLVVAFFTAKYALNRFYREKWWDRKVAIYIELVESIYVIKKSESYRYGQFLDENYGYDNAYESLSEQDEKKLQDDYSKARKVLEKTEAMAPLLLNTKCQQLISKYLNTESNLLTQWRNDDIEREEVHHISFKTANDLLTSIINEARKDLRSDTDPLFIKILNSFRTLLSRIEAQNYDK